MMGPRLLIVDDEPEIRKALMRVFADEGYQIYTASNAAQAISLLEQQAMDVVLSDERMPGMSGVEFLKFARERYPNTVRIILTANANTQMMLKAINEGEIFRFFLKPWDDEKLLATVRLGIERARGKADATAESQKAEKEKLLKELELQYPGIASIRRDADGTIIL